jgi:2-polyprenyl-6-methoxyphenol hydroxylase-like FAD-dependent oxidoreductase
MSHSPNIAILGAGPAGLTLARLLQQHNISCTIYEADENRHFRNQGGSLDLHPKAGQAALLEAGLIEEFRKHSRPEGDANKHVRFDGHIFWDDDQLTEEWKGDERKPEIDRDVLRSILLDSIEPRRIQWNRRISRVESEGGKSTLHFADGSSESGIDLLVGSDGAWSKVRPVLTDLMPFYSGVTMVELWSSNVSVNNPTLSKFVGSGTMFMFDEGRAIIAQRMGDDSIRTYAGLRQPLNWKDTCGIDWNDHDTARKEIVQQYYGDCSDELKHTILESRDGFVVRPLWMLPVGITWPHKAGVTLIGDAAHLMTPFAGVGVNLAMTDALTLARALIGRKEGLGDSESVNAAVKSYETYMFEHAKGMAEKTAQGLKGHFSAGGEDRRVKMFRAEYEQHTGKSLSEDHFNDVAVA